jgi:hypothetical protein
VGEDERHVVAGWLQGAVAAGGPEARFDQRLCLSHGIGAQQDDPAPFRRVRSAADGLYRQAVETRARLA